LQSATGINPVIRKGGLIHINLHTTYLPTILLSTFKLDAHNPAGPAKSSHTPSHPGVSVIGIINLATNAASSSKLFLASKR
jgi:hypothetical protein